MITKKKNDVGLMQIMLMPSCKIQILCLEDNDNNDNNDDVERKIKLPQQKH